MAVLWGHGFRKLHVAFECAGEPVGPGRALIFLLCPPLSPSPRSPGPLRSMVEDLRSEESDEDDSSSGEEASGKTNAGRDSRCPGRRGASRVGVRATRGGSTCLCCSWGALGR